MTQVRFLYKITVSSKTDVSRNGIGLLFFNNPLTAGIPSLLVTRITRPLEDPTWACEAVSVRGARSISVSRDAPDCCPGGARPHLENHWPRQGPFLTGSN